MKKKLSLLFCLIVMGIFCVKAEEWPDVSELMPLPLKSEIRHGVLDNGLNYFILHNEEPKGKANFYIAQKVGSTQEEPSQYGLAHFLEHMAFNGSVHFPPGSLDRYLQSKGLRNGADINAGTGYDQTVYNINNVPTSDQNLMDSVLLVLYDMSCGILLEESEIDAERGVIREEMRVRENSMQRMLQTISPQIFPEPQYQHPIIGTEDVIMNFTPETIRQYYKKWYRPDLQGIIIVGDFDAQQMEQKVVELFSQVPMPENPAKRIYPPFSGNEKPIYAHYSDTEMSYDMALIMFKDEPVPTEIRNTLQMYLSQDMPKVIISLLINQRLDEYGQNPDCSYANADVSFGSFLISKAADAFSIEVISKNDINRAVTEAMSVVARACKTGFTESEYNRVKEIILSDLQNQLNEKDKTNNGALAQEIIQYFLNNTPNPGIEAEYQIWNQGFMLFSVDEINQICSELLTPENLVVVCAQPDKEGITVTSEDVMIGNILDALQAEYEPYVEETIDEPLISSLPAPGKITDKKVTSDIGTIYTLSNGVKVVVKDTDFSADEILFLAFKEGGYQSYAASQAPDVLMMSGVFDNAKFGPFDQINLRKYLAGKKVSIDLGLDGSKDVISGRSTIKNFPDLLEILYTSFTNLQPDLKAFNAYLDSEKAKIVNFENTPDYIFNKIFQETVYSDNPFKVLPSVKLYDGVNYEKAFELVQKMLSSASDFTFLFVGNLDEEMIEPLLEQYIAILPKEKISKPQILTPISIAKGQIVKDFSQIMQTPSVTIGNLYSGYNLSNTLKNQIMMRMAGQVVSTVFTETLREEEGGTYTPYATGLYDSDLNIWEILYQVSTAPEKKTTIMDRADAEMNNIFTNGSSADHFGRIKEMLLQQYKNNSRNNQVMRSWILTQLLYPQINYITDYENVLNSITLEEFNSFLKKLYNGDNRIQVIMSPAQ